MRVRAYIYIMAIARVAIDIYIVCAVVRLFLIDIYIFIIINCKPGKLRKLRKLVKPPLYLPGICVCLVRCGIKVLAWPASLVLILRIMVEYELSNLIIVPISIL